MIRRWDGKHCAFTEPVKMDYRFSPEEPNENGLTMADTFGLIDALVQKPLQYLHVSQWEFEKKARCGADTNKARLELIHQRINGKLPLIGVGNIFTADQALKAAQTIYLNKRL